MKGENNTTLSVYPETTKDLDDIIEATKSKHPKTNKKEVLYFLVKQYKQELGIEERGNNKVRAQEVQIAR